MSRLDSEKRAKVRDNPHNSRTQEPLICARWMTARLRTVKPLDSVAHARAVLEEHRINQLPVVKNGMLVGIVTDRDLRDAVTTSAHLAGTVEPVPQAPDEIPVEAVMTHNVITLAPHSTIVTAAELMRRERIGSVPIVDRHTLAGIVTRSDILEAFVWRENGRSERAGRNRE
jgi:acetoin utilization protein AcuB